MADVAAEFDSKELTAFLKQVQDNYRKLTKNDIDIWKAFSAIAFADVIKHFEQEAGPTGRWTKWSDLYEKHLNRIGRGGNKILQFSGRMRGSIQMTNEASRARNGILLFNPAQTSRGFPYAKAHNEGGPKLPKRQYFWLSDRAMDLIVLKTLDFMLEEKGVS